MSPGQVEVENYKVRTTPAPFIDVTDEMHRPLTVSEHSELTRDAVLVERFPDEPDIRGVVLDQDNPGRPLARLRFGTFLRPGG